MWLARPKQNVETFQTSTHLAKNYKTIKTFRTRTNRAQSFTSAVATAPALPFALPRIQRQGHPRTPLPHL